MGQKLILTVSWTVLCSIVNDMCSSWINNAFAVCIRMCDSDRKIPLLLDYLSYSLVIKSGVEWMTVKDDKTFSPIMLFAILERSANQSVSKSSHLGV